MRRRLHSPGQPPRVVVLRRAGRTGAIAATVVLALGSLPFAAFPKPRPGSPCRVAIEQPLEGEILYGSIDLFARVECPRGEEADRVIFLIDGEIIAESTRPPHHAFWDAGDAFRPHLVEVRLIDRHDRVASPEKVKPE